MRERREKQIPRGFAFFLDRTNGKIAHNQMGHEDYINSGFVKEWEKPDFFSKVTGDHDP